MGSGSVRRQRSGYIAEAEREYWQRLHDRVCGFCDQPGSELRIDHGTSVKECAHRSCWQEHEHQYQTPTRIVVFDRPLPTPSRKSTPEESECSDIRRQHEEMLQAKAAHQLHTEHVDRPAIERQPIEWDAEWEALTPTELLPGDWVDDGVHADLDVCVFSEELFEEVEIRESDYSTRQLNWQKLPAWELKPQTRWEDTLLLDSPHTPAASAQHGSDLGAKPATSADTAWEIAVDTELQRDARLEALAIRQIAFSLAKAFETPLQPDEPRGQLPQIRGHVRVGPPIAA